MSPTPPEGRAYRSIFLSRTWAHQAYFGWRTLIDEPGFRVLAKRHAAVERYLVLLEDCGLRPLQDWLDKIRARRALSDIIVHDFDGVFDDRGLLHRQAFSRASAGERILNIATFAVDLSQDETALFARLSPDYRRKVRKAEKAAVQVAAFERPSDELQARFLNAFSAFAQKRGVREPDAAALRAMYAAGDATLFVATKGDAPTHYLHVFKAETTAFFMYGVGLTKENDGAGQYLHWEAMRWLKAAGMAWYDLGGVVGRRPDDGIFQFKKKFGGAYVDLGVEWRQTGAIARVAASALRGARSLSSGRSLR
ncbi:MAG: GNAT family N-acetyltransferase [Pseudomonadota bacterium]